MDKMAAPQEVRRAQTGPTSVRETPVLTVIIPVYNEARTIDPLLRRVLAAPYAKQGIGVDDGSTDGTGEILKPWEGYLQVVLLQHGKNRGKGAAIRTGLDCAQGRFTIIQDGDLEYDPEDYPRLIEPLLAGEAQVVYGSRYLRAEVAAHAGRPSALSRLKLRVPEAATLYDGRPPPARGFLYDGRGPPSDVVVSLPKHHSFT
jgi:glycosyltransferase involved in cell wall biosynthesis